MKTPGMIRKVDELGRIVIPHEIRKALEIRSGDNLELTREGDCLILHKFETACIFCGGKETLSVYRDKCICLPCLQNLRKV